MHPSGGMDMAQLMLIDDDLHTLVTPEERLRAAGHRIAAASSGRDALMQLRREPVDLIMCALPLPDMSAPAFLQQVRDARGSIAVIVVSGHRSAQEAVAARQLGADVIEPPISEPQLIDHVRHALTGGHGRLTNGHALDLDAPDDHEAHAAARWARVLMPIIDARKDPRTIVEWSRLAFVSPGALRNWCRMAGISPRRSLVFARLLRAVFLARGGKHKPENLLDVADRRTLVGLLRLSGLNPQQDFPDHVDVFLQRQSLVRDPDALLEIKRALRARRQQGGGSAARR